ncbi:hypothetical protein [Pseudonocardia sp. NPDC049635]|uniref:hypothetical protein n=1 Tax=Pseudonocardia sp. NPDC049635 TaxID=3155506 RepID=UPI0033F7F89F
MIPAWAAWAAAIVGAAAVVAAVCDCATEKMRELWERHRFRRAELRRLRAEGWNPPR